MTILGVDHIKITVPADGLDDARRFYCDLLGLPEIPKPEPVLKNGGFWLQAGACQVHIGLEDGADRRKSSVHIGYVVDDITAWRAKFVEANVEILEATQIPHVERFYVRDPSGNRIEFMLRI